MFGRQPSLPIDAVFEKATDESVSKATNEYIVDLQERMAATHEIVMKHTEKSKEKQKKYYDKKTKAVQFSIGDRVLVKRLAFDGKHKLADKFEPETYIVIAQNRPDIPVFRVKSETSDREKTIHRNHLLPLESRDVPIKPDEPPVLEKKRDTKIVDASKYQDEKKISKKDDVISEKDSSDSQY